MDNLKKKVAAVMSCASSVREGDKIKLLTAAGIIQGTAIYDFDERLSENGKVNAYIMDIVLSAADEESKTEFVFLKDVEVINGNASVHLEHLVVFTEEIIGLCL